MLHIQSVAKVNSWLLHHGFPDKPVLSEDDVPVFHNSKKSIFRALTKAS